jgi:hypothetical protein
MHTMTRTQRILLTLGSIFLMGACARGCGEQRTPTIVCRDVDIRVSPGECMTFTNPCGTNNLWVAPPLIDALRLCDAPVGISVHKRDVNGQVERSICARENVPPFGPRPFGVEYEYATSRNSGRASFNISLASPLTVIATATPSTINPGDSSQLVANATGGAPPYFYGWSPAGSLNDNDIAAPIASPTVTTTYTVGVTDASRVAQAATSVTVNVRNTLRVTASPSTVNLGDPSALEAIAEGGVPPYTFAWVPAETLDDASRADPIARPANTTTYLVIVTDALGVQRNGSATVTVNLVVGVTATPASIPAGNSSQLQANVQGGTLPYSYSWSPAASLNDNTLANPVATPSATTSYTVVVTDGAGNTANAGVTVTVTGGGPTACFTYTTNSGSLNLDASCSTGGVVRYEWDFSFIPGNPNLSLTTPIVQTDFPPNATGTITLTVFDAGGASASTALPFPPS